MSKVILVHGEEALLCDEYIKSLLPDDPMSIEKYDMRENSIIDVLIDASQGSLFGSDDKILVLNDCYFLGSEKALSDKEMESVTEFINNKENTTTVVFRYTKLDKRKKLVKALMKSAEVFEGKLIKFPQSWINTRSKAYKLNLEKNAVDKMVVQLGVDLYLLDNELKKIQNRFPSEKLITADMLSDVLSRTLESDVFKLLDRIMYRQASAIDLLSDLLMTGNDPIQVLLLIIRQLRMIEQIKIAEITGNPVQNYLTVHPYALQIAKEQAEDYTLSDIQSKMDQVATLDLKMKRGQVDKVIALETLILQWM
ncbi:DNA polymerase III subunit delta [Lysinibacillus sp. UGB7]|uniref:DNA polymerase III subunit delta n=1 Tax=Lysinibacillus sp. UGB7 TaxID=3411039 RepID=UPI003B7979D6